MFADNSAASVIMKRVMF